jgi:Putative addiction module component
MRHCRLRETSYPLGMRVPVENLTEEALALPADARALLADRLVESLDPLTDDAVRALWTAEAIRRRDEVRAGTVETIDGDIAADRIRALFVK